MAGKETYVPQGMRARILDMSAGEVEGVEAVCRGQLLAQGLAIQRSAS